MRAIASGLTVATASSGASAALDDLCALRAQHQRRERCVVGTRRGDAVTPVRRDGRPVLWLQGDPLAARVGLVGLVGLVAVQRIGRRLPLERSDQRVAIFEDVEHERQSLTRVILGVI